MFNDLITNRKLDSSVLNCLANTENFPTIGLFVNANYNSTDSIENNIYSDELIKSFGNLNASKEIILLTSFTQDHEARE